MGGSVGAASVDLRSRADRYRRKMRRLWGGILAASCRVHPFMRGAFEVTAAN